MLENSIIIIIIIPAVTGKVCYTATTLQCYPVAPQEQWAEPLVIPSRFNFFLLLILDYPRKTTELEWRLCEPYP